MKHIIFVIDRSGSMSGIHQEMNNVMERWLEDNKRKKAVMTSVLFDDSYDVTNDKTPLQEVTQTSMHIIPRGSTALFDAFMKATSGITKKNKALVFVVTDGQENASKEHKLKDVQERIAELEKNGTIVEYLSASPTAFADGLQYGFAASSTQAFDYSPQGTQMVANSITRSSKSYLDNTQE